MTGDNPSWWVKDELPVERVSWYDAIYFCNELSRLTGKTPVYSVNGESDVTKWNYIPNSDQSINAAINQNMEADGYRLPTSEEWLYAAKGGENYTYSGSDNLDEVGWDKDNSGNKTHPVAQKKPNGYGLYDMSGNVWEWIWDTTANGMRYKRGGAYSDLANYSQVSNYLSEYNDTAARQDILGFRIAHNINGKSTVKSSENSGPKLSELIPIPGRNYEIGNTEVTQALYESVMGKNTSYFKGENLPVENLSFYDILYFCNEYSRLSGLTPVYAVDGETNVYKWNYKPHTFQILKGKITMDETANGYRLPTREEWRYAANDGQNLNSDNIDDVCWNRENSEDMTHPVAQKKPNGYGLYDMRGNVMEWAWGDLYGREDGYGSALGGSAYTESQLLLRNNLTFYTYNESDRNIYLGFRLARNKD